MDEYADYQDEGFYMDADTYFDDEDGDYEFEDNYTDAEADAMTLASIGWGTDEDYGYYGE